ncbi:MAG TPA: hypothetical protein DDW52_29950 [Planctomycetaceae bacterium]|nr:hypothetical protein [Planctomycetaceae bacterium]
MPRTASIQKSLRAARKSRPNQISAPVLFRFPDLCETTTEQEHASDGTSQPTERVAGEADTEVSSHLADATSAEVATAEATAAQNLGSTTTVVSSIEPAEASQPSATNDANLAAAITSKTWWEHWSSGIVLLLLVGALLFASAFAFNNSSSPDPDNLAAADQNQLAIPSLGDIEIPEIDTQLSLPEPSPPASSPETEIVANQDQAPKHSLAPSAPSLSGSMSLDSSLDSTDSLIPPSLAIDAGDVTESKTTPTESNPQLATNAGGPPAASTPNAPQQTMQPQPAVATASLARPSVASATVGLPILDETAGSPDAVHAAASTNSVPALPAGSRLGESPALYNGAQNAALSRQASETAGLGSATGPQLAGGNNIGLAANQPTSADNSGLPGTETSPRTSPAAGNHTQTSAQGQASNKSVPAHLASGHNRLPSKKPAQPSNTPTDKSNSAATVPGGPMLTDSPTMDPRAVIEAWRNYKAEQIAQPPTSDNRYLPPPAR